MIRNENYKQKNKGLTAALIPNRRNPFDSCPRLTPRLKLVFPMEITKIIGREILDSRGNPDGGGRRSPGRRQHWPRRRSLRRIDRRARSSRASRRRQVALPGQRDAQGRQEYREAHRARAARSGCGTAKLYRSPDDQARRDRRTKAISERMRFSRFPWLSPARPRNRSRLLSIDI